MSRRDENKQIEMTVSSDWMGLVDDRLNSLEESVKRVETNTSAVVEAFSAAQGAFKVLEWLGKVAKPLLWIGGVSTLWLAVIKQLPHTSFGRFFIDFWK